MTRLTTLALLFAVMTTGCFVTSEEDSTLTVSNESSYVITQLHIAPIGFEPFDEPNELFSPLFPDEAVTFALDCGTYDLGFVDDEDVKCYVDGIRLCFEDGLFVIDDFKILVECEFGVASKKTPTE